jgi:serine/threonine-protein kinase PknG
MTESMVRDLLVSSYLELGRLTDDAAVRAGYVDLANTLRPWSLL